MSRHPPDQAPESPAEHPPLGTLFLTVFMDLVGFSVIFPLFPAMLAFYLGREGEESLLGALVGLLGSLTPAGGDGAFLVTVLFGGLLGSLFAALQFISAPLLGRLSDRRGRRPVLLITVAGNAVGYVLWAFSDSFLLLLVSRIVGGVMSGNLSVASAAIADVTPPERRARGMALIGVAFGLGFVVGPGIGGLSAQLDLADRFPSLVALGINPFSTPALAAFALSVINLLVVARRLPETLAPQHRSVRRPRSLGRLLWHPTPGIRRAGVVNLLFTLGFSGMEFSLTFLVTERLGYGPTDNALVFLYLGVVLILTQGLLVRRFSPRTGERLLALSGLAVGAAAFVAMALAGSAPAIYGGLTLMALAAGLINPSLSALVSRYAADQDQGETLGLFRSAGSAARGIGPLFAAAAYFALGSRTAYLIGGGTALLPLLLAFGLPRPDPPLGNTPLGSAP